MKLSVATITYNHESFIRHALDSVLMQQTDFEYEIVVGEDCSTDRTREIVVEYEKRHPGKVRLLQRERNLGITRNLADTIEHCRGQYVALLEGDDYWTHSHKLQKQVDFLDASPDFALCFHDVDVRQEGKEPRLADLVTLRGRTTFTLEDLLTTGNFISTCSVVFRNHLFGAFPDWFYQLRIGDFPLNVLNAQHGKIGYLHEVMAAYRIHPGGAFSGANRARKVDEVVRMYECVSRHLGPRHARTIRGVQSYWEAVEYFRMGDIDKARERAVHCLEERPLNKRVVLAALMLYAPRFYRLLRRLRPLDDDLAAGPGAGR